LVDFCGIADFLDFGNKYLWNCWNVKEGAHRRTEEGVSVSEERMDDGRGGEREGRAKVKV